ncbi:MAG: hypothetical protein WDN76_02900 [Alphaproteobacteria bacterium]
MKLKRANSWRKATMFIRNSDRSKNRSVVSSNRSATVTALKVATRNPTEWEDFLARAKQFVEAGLLTDAEVAYARQIRDRLQKTYPALPR